MVDPPSTSGRFVPQVYTTGYAHGPRFQRPVATVALDYFRLGAYQLLTVGGAAALAKTAVAPLERVKILMQVQPMLAPQLATRASQPILTLRQGLRTIVQTQGWTGLYRGNGANVARLFPEVLLKFAVNDQFKIIFASTTDTKQMSLGSRLAAGTATGVLRTLAFHPLSVIRTRLAADLGAAGAPRAAASVLACVRDTWRGGGVRAFYGGMGMAMLTTVPYLAVCFSVYDELQSMLPQDKHACQLWWYPLAKIGMGAASGVVAQSVTYPLDTVRRRLEVNRAPGFKVAYPGAWACVASILQNEGWGALYRGCFVNCLKAAPSAAIQFVMYDTIKSAMMAIDPATAASSPL